MINNSEQTNMIYEDEFYAESKKRIMAKKHSTPANTDFTAKIKPKKKFHLKDMKQVVPKTATQREVFEEYVKNPETHKFLYGSAGTGKTFISMALGLKDVLSQETPYEHLLIVRSIVPSRDIGWLPGDIDEKTSAYEEPYVAMCDEIFNVTNSYEELKNSGLIKFTSTSFLRGKTFNDAVILVDEMQNMNFGELDTVITRVGHNSKIIFAGDIRQNDLSNKRNEASGFTDFFDIIRSMRKHFSVFEFDHDDIVRSGLVKEYIIRKETLFRPDDDEFISGSQKF